MPVRLLWIIMGNDHPGWYTNKFYIFSINNLKCLRAFSQLRIARFDLAPCCVATMPWIIRF